MSQGTGSPSNGNKEQREGEEEDKQIEGALPVEEIDPSDEKHVNVANVRALLARAKRAANGNLRATREAVDLTKHLADTGLLKALRFQRKDLSDTDKFNFQEKVGTD